MLRKRILALLFMAICLLGILPLSVSALTPAIEGATYTYVNANVLPSDEFQTEPILTPISGQLHYFVCEDSPDIDGTVAIDIYTSEITEIGYLANLDYHAVVMNVNITFTAYIPAMSPIPIAVSKVPAILQFIKLFSEPRTIVICSIPSQNAVLTTYVSLDTDVKFTLTEILDTTDMGILNTTLDAFSTELTTENYVDWFLDGYNGIIDVFVNNAKIQYVMDNPIFIIALVVFAMAITFAIATFIFKIFRRY